jgi:hypothetical protein
VRDELTKARLGIIDRDVAIATLEKQLRESAAELDRALGELEEMKVKAGNVGQLNLFPPEPEPEPITAVPVFETEPENIKSPAVNSEPLIVTPTEVQAIPLILLDTIEGTVPRKVIMDRILEIDPATEINGQIITDAVLGHNQRLSELETTYGFKFVGYVMRGKNREYRYKIS